MARTRHPRPWEGTRLVEPAPCGEGDRGDHPDAQVRLGDAVLGCGNGQADVLAAVGEVTEVSHDDGADSYRVGLECGTKPSDDDRVAARLESDARHAGYVMTHFHPYLGEAALVKMTVGT